MPNMADDLFDAIERTDVDRLRRLLDAGADIREARDGWTPLHHAVDIEVDSAAQTGGALHVDITALLVARGADPLSPDTQGVTPLESAESRGHWLAGEVMRALLSRRT